jgi:hypothetical protein
VEIYSIKDATGRKLSVHKERVGPGVAAYFIDVSTPRGAQRCALSATSAWSLGRALLCSVHDDVPEPARKTPPPAAADTGDASRGRLTANERRISDWFLEVLR